MKVVRRLSAGLLVIEEGPFGPCLWAKWNSRKAGRCVATGRNFPKGTPIFGPLTSGNNRGHRVLAKWVEEQK